MRRILITGLVALIMVLSLPGCNLSFQNLNPTPFFPTPNYTMTALFTVDESLLTKTPPDFAVNTAEPELPTVGIPDSATAVPTQVVPSNTSSPTVVPPSQTPLAYCPGGQICGARSFSRVVMQVRVSFSAIHNLLCNCTEFTATMGGQSSPATRWYAFGLER